jgi:hypothetical protein
MVDLSLIGMERINPHISGKDQPRLNLADS